VIVRSLRALLGKAPRSEPAHCERLVYAIGDVHGRADLLRPLLRQIASDAGRIAAPARPAVVFLGDYVDRGPDSRLVVDAIVALRASQDVEVRCLKGNHEEALLRFLDDPEFGPAWARHGGAATLASYGVPVPGPRDDAGKWRDARDAFVAALGHEGLRFFEQLERFWEAGSYIFVHAGVSWDKPLAQQTDLDLFWSRESFLGRDGPFERIVVHGHTPAPTVIFGRHRIGIDTGAYATGKLSALRLYQETRHVIVSSRDATY
jgi:serine/threonine protein phosphatase 1